MNRFSPEQIAQLAPDAGSLKAGRDLANERKWLSYNLNDRALWGEVQGSGKDPYRTQVDLEETAFKCSCPSRKFPCKHGLGLLFLWANRPDIFKKTDQEPEWVSEWIEKRRKRSEAAAPSTSAVEDAPPVDKAAEKRAKDKAKRADNRMALVQGGVAELELMLRDLLRHGFVTTPEKGSAFFDKTVRRMVDAKAPGLVNWVRNFNKINYLSGNGWQEEAFENAVKTWLLLDAFRNLEQLDAPLQEQIRSLTGWTYQKKDLFENSALTTVEDDWLPVGKLVEALDDEVTVMHRTWLWGRNTRRTALLMDFVTPYNPAENLVIPGVPLRAELVFYPSNYLLRAQIKSKTNSNTRFEPAHAHEGWEAAQRDLAETWSLSPWADDVPQLVAALSPARNQEIWYLKDRFGRIVPIDEIFGEARVWQLLASTGGQSCDMWVLRRGKAVLPMGAFVGQTYKVFLTN